MKPAVVVPCTKAQSARQLLEREGLWDKTRKLQKHHDDCVLIPVNTADVADLLSCHLPEIKDLVSVIQADLPPSKSEQLVTPAQQLLIAVGKMLDCCDRLSSSRERLMREVPSHWEKHGDLVLLPASAFLSAEWALLGQELWQTVARCTGACRVARQEVVSADGFRTPQVTLLLGENAVVQHIDNAIKYEYDLTHCMFSAGNISEKLRIAGFNCTGETVVDLYAGIGYFTLPYLVHAGATHVHACEWNPDAVAALRRNLELNHVETRCTVYAGDNRQLALKGVADRVNLGLIPSSEEGWPVACRVLKPTGGILHVHGNVNAHTALGERHPVHQATDTASAVTVENSKEMSVEGMLQEGVQAGGEVLSRMQATLLQENSGELLEMVAHTNLVDDSKHPQKSCEGEEISRSDREKKQPVSLSTEQEILVQRGLSTSDSTSKDASVQPCSEKNQQLPCAKCDLCSSHQQEHTIQDSSLSRLRPGSCSKRSSLPHASKIFPDTQDQCSVVRCSKASLLCSKTAAWQSWGDSVCQRLESLLEKEHGGCWQASVSHIENVKSYAPHVNHLVLDVLCTPVDANL